MPKKEDLLNQLLRKPPPCNFTIFELDTLMGKCGCKKYSGGRGSGIAYTHEASGRKLAFDGPHPKSELYKYMIEKVIKFLKETGEI